MNRRWKVVTLALITAAALSVCPLMAQTISDWVSDPPSALGVPLSNTANATQELFGTDVDDFLSYHSYSDVEFDKWFGYAGYGDSYLSLGYARRFGGIYLGLNYTGNIFQASETKKTETISSTYDQYGNNTAKDAFEDNLNKTLQPDNEIDVLIGVAGMGIKVGFSEDLKIVEGPQGTSNLNQKNENPQTGRINYVNTVDSFTNISGNFIPSLGWGMVLDLGGLKIKPLVDAAFLIHREHSEDIRKNYSTEQGKVIDEQISVLTNGANKQQNYFRPEITAGADLVLMEKDTLELDAGLKYTIGFALYSNDYDVFGISGSTKGFVTSLTGTQRISEGYWGANEYRSVAAALSEQSDLRHTIAPSFSYYNTLNGNVDIGFNLAPKFLFGSLSETTWTETKTVTVSAPTTQGGNRVTTTVVDTTGKAETTIGYFQFAPAITTGIKYTAIPDRFVLNAGIGAGMTYTRATQTKKPAGFGRKVTTEVDANGNTTETVDANVAAASIPTTLQRDSVAVINAWEGLTGTVSGGFTFYFTPKVTVDASLSSSTTNKFTIDTNQLQLLFTIKN
jgi:hypothetical protein